MPGESRPGGRGKEEPPPSATRSRGDGCGGGTAAIKGFDGGGAAIVSYRCARTSESLAWMFTTPLAIQ